MLLWSACCKRSVPMRTFTIADRRLSGRRSAVSNGIWRRSKERGALLDRLCFRNSKFDIECRLGGQTADGRIGQHCYERSLTSV